MTDGPEVGDAIWWRGMRMEITEVDEARGIVRYSGVHAMAHYRCTSNTADFVWREDLELWTMPGVEGPMPKLVRGEIVDPEPSRCISCGEVTFRGSVCTNCRLKGVKEPPRGVQLTADEIGDLQEAVDEYNRHSGGMQ